MMSLGSILIRPQRLRRTASLDPGMALVDDLLQLISRATADPALLEILGQAFEAAGERLQQHAATGLETAQGRIQDWMRPLRDNLQNLAADPPGSGNPAAGLDLARQLLSQLADLLGDLNLDRLREQMSFLLDVMQTDLGLTSEFLQNQVWALVDDIVQRLEQAPPGTDLSARDNRLQAASLLKRIRRRTRDRFVFPELDAETLARNLLRLLRGSAIEPLTRQAACITEGLNGVVEVGNTLTRLAPFPGFGPASPGVGADGANGDNGERFKYAWYASWLLGSKDRTGGNILAALPLPWMPDPYADIWIDLETQKAMRATLFGGGEGELKGSNDNPIPGSFTDWTQLPHFDGTYAGNGEGPYYTFGAVQPDTMEQWAFHTAWAADALRTTLHLTSIEEGDWISNAANAGFHLGHGTFKFFAHQPFNWWLPVVTGREHPALWWILSRTPLPTLGGSFQKMHTDASFGNALKFWLWLLLGDGMESYILNYVVNIIRNGFLSGLTLANHDNDIVPAGKPDVRAANREEIDGITDLVSLLLGQIPLGVESREDYGVIGQNSDHTIRVIFLRWLAINASLSLAWSLAGTLIAQGIARSFDIKVVAKKVGIDTVISLITYWPTLYLSLEGDTDNGKYNPNGAAFSGYPGRGNSPYRLPWEEGKSVLCAQGNQGLWSHNNVHSGNRAGFTPQIYAYDFALDQDEEILAARAGTVVDYFDWVPDDTDPDNWIPVDPADTGVLRAGQSDQETWNFILIRHDLDAGGNPGPGNVPVGPDANHDKDQGSAVVTTYAVYGHGRKGSVRAVFAAQGIAANQIIGQRIQRGQPIMRTGDTGVSAFNHLHIDVRPGPAAPSPLPAPAAAVPVHFRNDLVKRTLPFVFGEVGHKLELNRFTRGIEGVPSAWNYYTSANPRVT